MSALRIARARPLHPGATESRRRTKAKNNGFLVLFRQCEYHRAEEITEKKAVLKRIFRALLCRMKPMSSKEPEESIIFCFCSSPRLCGSGGQRFCSCFILPLPPAHPGWGSTMTAC